MGLPQISRRAFHAGVLARGGAGLLVPGTVAGAAYDACKFPPQARVVLEALKSHGMILADNGGDWFVSGAPDPRWDDEDLATLKRVKVRDFELVAMGTLVTR